MELAHDKDEHVLRGPWAPSDFLQAQIREVEEPIAKTAALPRFKDEVQILQGFRGMGLLTAMQLLCELGEL